MKFSAWFARFKYRKATVYSLVYALENSSFIRRFNLRYFKVRMIRLKSIGFSK